MSNHAAPRPPVFSRRQSVVSVTHIGNLRSRLRHGWSYVTRKPKARAMNTHIPFPAYAPRAGTVARTGASASIIRPIPAFP